MFNDFWELIVEPVLMQVQKRSNKSLRDIVAELVESGTTLGYLAQKSGFLKELNKFGLMSFVRELAKKVNESDVEEFIRWLLDEALKEKLPGLCNYLKSDPEANLWFRQSIYELWRLVLE